MFSDNFSVGDLNNRATEKKTTNKTFNQVYKNKEKKYWDRRTQLNKSIQILQNYSNNYFEHIYINQDLKIQIPNNYFQTNHRSNIRMYIQKCVQQQLKHSFQMSLAQWNKRGRTDQQINFINDKQFTKFQLKQQIKKVNLIKIQLQKQWNSTENKYLVNVIKNIISLALKILSVDTQIKCYQIQRLRQFLRQIKVQQLLILRDQIQNQCLLNKLKIQKQQNNQSQKIEENIKKQKKYYYTQQMMLKNLNRKPTSEQQKIIKNKLSPFQSYRLQIDPINGYLKQIPIYGPKVLFRDQIADEQSQLKNIQMNKSIQFNKKIFQPENNNDKNQQNSLYKRRNFFHQNMRRNEIQSKQRIKRLQMMQVIKKAELNQNKQKMQQKSEQLQLEKKD